MSDAPLAIAQLTLALGADHAGLPLKRLLAEALAAAPNGACRECGVAKRRRFAAPGD
jgi:hypothetical protein